MKTLLCVLALIIITGCDVDSNNHGYGFEYDTITSLGIEYRNDGHDQNALTETFLNDHFLKVYNCIRSYQLYNNTRPVNEPDFAINLMVVSVMQIGNTSKEAQHYSDPSLIVLLDRDSPYHTTNTGTALDHEYVHYILKQLTGWSSPEHHSAYFKLCA